MLFWYLRISRSATVPGLKRYGFLTPPVFGADLRAAMAASVLRGAWPPVLLRAVCLVLAIGCLGWVDGGWGLKYVRTLVPEVKFSRG